MNVVKTLYVLRHAKSSWEDTDLADFDRPLNDRGERAAPFMGKLMRDKSLVPNVILSSPAKRAKKTAKLAKEAAEFAAEIRYEERIYEASPQALGQAVSELDDAYDSAMLVGHNPGMEGFIRLLTGQTEPMPTAALAVIQLDIDSWSNADSGCGELKAVYRPKEEMKERMRENAA